MRHARSKAASVVVAVVTTVMTEPEHLQPFNVSNRVVRSKKRPGCEEYSRRVSFIAKPRSVLERQ